MHRAAILRANLSPPGPPEVVRAELRDQNDMTVRGERLRAWRARQAAAVVDGSTGLPVGPALPELPRET